MGKTGWLLICMVALGLFCLAGRADATRYLYRDLGTLGGRSSTATSINNHSQVEGYSWDYSIGFPSSRAFLWMPARGMTDLNNLVNKLPAGITLRQAFAINQKLTVDSKGETFRGSI